MSEEKKGFFARLKEGLTKTRNNIVHGIDSVFGGFSKIAVINSEAGTVSQGLMVIEAGRMCQNGVPYEQCVDILEKMKKTNRIFFTVGNTDYLKHGGRIGKLAGIAAGMKTESNKLGYVAAMGQENSEVTGGINAFAMGAYSVNPDCEVYVKVTNSWFSPDLEKQAASEISAKINDKKVIIKAKAGNNSKLFGSVTSGHVSDALSEQFGVKVDKKKINLKNDIKNFGTYDAVVKLYTGITANITIEVIDG